MSHLLSCFLISSHLISLSLSIFSSQLIFYDALSRFSFLSFCSVLFNFNFIFVASILYRLNSFYFNSYFCDNFNQLIIHNIPYFIPLLSCVFLGISEIPFEYERLTGESFVLKRLVRKYCRENKKKLYYCTIQLLSN